MPNYDEGESLNRSVWDERDPKAGEYAFPEDIVRNHRCAGYLGVLGVLSLIVCVV